jgi:hypothetical protein
MNAMEMDDGNEAALRSFGAPTICFDEPADDNGETHHSHPLFLLSEIQTTIRLETTLRYRPRAVACSNCDLSLEWSALRGADYSSRIYSSTFCCYGDLSKQFVAAVRAPVPSLLCESEERERGSYGGWRRNVRIRLEKNATQGQGGRINLVIRFGLTCR